MLKHTFGKWGAYFIYISLNMLSVILYSYVVIIQSVYFKCRESIPYCIFVKIWEQ